MGLIDNDFKEKFKLLNVKIKQFDFFDIIPPKEVLVSKWIEFILNPSINGVGNIVAQKLIDLTGVQYNLNDYEFDSSNTEESTDNQKRIDIVLKYKGVWVVIENKIDSLENGEQTNEYYKYINSIKGNNEIIYIYLKPNYNKSIPINSKFKIVTYDKFINSLKEINIDDYYDKSRYKYLNEFIISGGRFMLNNEIEISDSIKFYIEELDKFCAIEEEYNIKNKLLYEKIIDNILISLNDNDEKYRCYRSGNWIQVYKSNWNNEKHNGIHFEVIFKDSKILGRIINADVVLHIECSTKQEILNKFESYGIIKNGNQALYKNEKIRESIKLNFTQSDFIDKSIEYIKNSLFNLIEQYEGLIDEVME